MRTVFVCALACLVAGLVRGQYPDVVAPDAADASATFYVAGLQADADQGRDDSRQTIFFKFPAGVTGEIKIFVHDPASGGGHERAGMGSGSVRTAFAVFGGEGAYTGDREIRPEGEPTGTRLAQAEYVNQHRNRWVYFGPFKPEQGERLGDHIYFKLVASGGRGSGFNLFKVGANHSRCRILVYDATLHLSRARGRALELKTTIPAGVEGVLEQNFDLEEDGRTFFEGRPLTVSRSGLWVHTQVPFASRNQPWAATYAILKTGRGYANMGCYLLTDAGEPLPLYFLP